MDGKRFWKWMALVVCVPAMGCCSWCDHHCAQQRGPYYPQQPVCCQPAAPPCCPPGYTPVSGPVSGYQQPAVAAPRAASWNDPRCCQ
jgi:hypothetical protein